MTAGFYRDLVWNLRNGVLAVTRDGRIAVMNEVAYRILALPPRTTDIGRPFTQVLRDQPRRLADRGRCVRAVAPPQPRRAAVEEHGKGHRLHAFAGARPAAGSPARRLFFKDLTRVEQLEERERLRDRLAALGEMAAAIAHEVKNPLAGIEVMAGVLKRQLPDSEDAQSILKDIIKEAKMANAIVLEVLDFVRPIRLQVERVSLADVVRDAISRAESHIPAGRSRCRSRFPEDLRADPRGPAPAAAAVLESPDERVRGARRDGARSGSRPRSCR